MCFLPEKRRIFLTIYSCFPFFFSAKKEKGGPVYKCVCLFQDEQQIAQAGDEKMAVVVCVMCRCCAAVSRGGDPRQDVTSSACTHEFHTNGHKTGERNIFQCAYRHTRRYREIGEI